MIGDDLVNSYHLLLCCLDLVFGNALLCANRKDLINPTFRGVCARVCLCVLSVCLCVLSVLQWTLTCVVLTD